MAKLYDTIGKEFDVPYSIDVKEWKKQGYTEVKPIPKPKPKPKARLKSKD